MTEIYVFDGGSEPLPEAAARLLPPWRRERWERLRHEPARRESLCAGLLYAFALKKRGVSPDEPVTLLPAGKPVLAGRDDLYFSLSHSGRYAICAVSGAPVGADVQELRDVKPSMARRFHPRERDWLESRTEEEWLGCFFRLLTRKEAWVKAESAERMLSLSEADVIHGLPDRYFRDYVLPDGFRAAVCARSEEIGELIAVTRGELLAGSN